jgi:hypothetical protein
MSPLSVEVVRPILAAKVGGRWYRDWVVRRVLRPRLPSGGRIGRRERLARETALVQSVVNHSAQDCPDTPPGCVRQLMRQPGLLAKGETHR